jgi:1-acyl-sn-glycerol-3-phosphate acyltransferase
MGIAVEIGRFIVKRMFHRRYRLNFSYGDLDPETDSPYFLVANHPSALDPLYVAMNLVRYPYPVANIFLYTDPKFRFLLSKVVTSIPKRKGQSDTRTIRAILDAYKSGGSIMVFPEGNASFYGQTTPTDWIPTAKIAKKVGVDVVAAKIDGGYLAAPRWGRYHKGARVDVTYRTIISAEELKTMATKDIARIMQDALSFDDDKWREEHDVITPSDHRAEGLEHVIYTCPLCYQTATLHTKGNAVFCKNCGQIATIDDAWHLHGTPYKTIGEWGDAQTRSLDRIVSEGFESKGILKEIDFVKMRRIMIGKARIMFRDTTLWLITKRMTLSIDAHAINGIVMTEKNDISFDWNGKTWFISTDDPKLILDVINHTKERN